MAMKYTLTLRLLVVHLDPDMTSLVLDFWITSRLPLPSILLMRLGQSERCTLTSQWHSKSVAQDRMLTRQERKAVEVPAELLARLIARPFR